MRTLRRYRYYRLNEERRLPEAEKGGTVQGEMAGMAGAIYDNPFVNITQSQLGKYVFPAVQPVL